VPESGDVDAVRVAGERVDADVRVDGVRVVDLVRPCQGRAGLRVVGGQARYAGHVGAATAGEPADDQFRAVGFDSDGSPAAASGGAARASNEAMPVRAEPPALLKSPNAKIAFPAGPNTIRRTRPSSCGRHVRMIAPVSARCALRYGTFVRTVPSTSLTVS